MKAWLLSFIQTPAFEDDDDRRAAQLLRLVLAVCLLCIVGYGLATSDTALPWSRRLPLFGALAVALLCDRGLRRGYVRPQAWVIVVGLTALALVSQITSGGLRAPASLTLFVSVVLAGQLLGWGGALIVAGIGSVGTLGVFASYQRARDRAAAAPHRRPVRACARDSIDGHWQPDRDLRVEPVGDDAAPTA